MLDVLGYTFMQRAMTASVLIGLVCSIIGVYVVLRGLAFIGAGIAHASFGGVALGVVMGVNPLYTAIAFCLGTAWGIGFVSKKGKVKEDTAIGIFFASTMALGILLIGLLHEYNTDLFGYLFGSVLAISVTDLWLTVALCAGVLATVAAQAFFRFQRSTTDSSIGRDELRFKEAVVIVPLSEQTMGKVRVQVGMTVTEQYALAAHPGAAFGRGDTVRILSVSEECVYVGR